MKFFEKILTQTFVSEQSLCRLSKESKIIISEFSSSSSFNEVSFSEIFSLFSSVFEPDFSETKFDNGSFFSSGFLSGDSRFSRFLRLAEFWAIGWGRLKAEIFSSFSGFGSDFIFLHSWPRLDFRFLKIYFIKHSFEKISRKKNFNFQIMKIGFHLNKKKLPF